MALRQFFWKVSDFLKATNHSPFNIIAGRDGKLYEVRDSMLGRLVTHKSNVRELEEVQPGFAFRMPKLPGELLATTLSFFRAFCSEWEQNEVMVQLYWDKLTKQYFLECPHQVVSKARIKVQDYSEHLLHSSRYVQIMHIHSHNSMEAYFSSIDNDDEKAFMLYGVVGRLNYHQPDMLLRVGCNGEFIALPLGYIFENPILTPTSISYPKEWDDRVQITG
ncbi:hypothetical protein ACFPOG_12915 [Paenibacillus aestuarii]|uniref:JAB domain-containing protein n=1 Tax=Paenibacillus aestuarii TaxID=516965 RepID=A0ABW0K846_9BACL